MVSRPSLSVTDVIPAYESDPPSKMRNVEGKTTSPRWVPQPIFVPIRVKPDGNTTDRNELSFWNNCPGNSVIPLPKSTDTNVDCISANAELPIDCTESGIVIDTKRAPSNAAEPIDCTESGIVIDSNIEFWKALPSILMSVLGRDTRVMDRFWNAPEPITETRSGISKRPEHPALPVTTPSITVKFPLSPQEKTPEIGGSETVMVMSSVAAGVSTPLLAVTENE